MRFDCEAAREHIDAWALGALDADEARALEHHLAGCGECTRMADEARETASSLALAVPLTAAPSALKSRTMASAAVLSDIGRVERRARLWPAAAAALFIAGAGAITWGGLTQYRLNDLERTNARIGRDATVQSAELAAAQTEVVAAGASAASVRASNDTSDAVIDIVLQPDVQRTDLIGTDAAPSATARCLWSRETAVGAFVAKNLPPAPEGMSYHMWIVYELEWVKGGSFQVDEEGRGQLVMRRVWTQRPDLGGFEGFAVTLEPDGAQPTPTPGGALVLSSGIR
jgi:anti-sigma-K factor RskA